VSLITFNIELKSVSKHLRRIADALEQLIPPPQEAESLTPEEQVSYVDEDKIAELEFAEEAGVLDAYLQEHPELVEQEDEDGGLGVFKP